ncbi:hypothetical protein FACS1894113_4730 [Alphaproteobacteria bacterium]|nr:hypothetical protein FACS1894113_4730 [Alphaproteobacteria bacterium]
MDKNSFADCFEQIEKTIDIAVGLLAQSGGLSKFCNLTCLFKKNNVLLNYKATPELFAISNDENTKKLFETSNALEEHDRLCYNICKRSTDFLRRNDPEVMKFSSGDLPLRIDQIKGHLISTNETTPLCSQTSKKLHAPRAELSLA